VACAFCVCALRIDDAYAQSSVTLYGIIDNGIEYLSNVKGHAVTELYSGVGSLNILGFLGSEDLGGGNKAIFRLESGFDSGTGLSVPSGSLFGSQAYVGLSSDKYGTFTLGNQYDLLYPLGFSPVKWITTLAAGASGGLGTSMLGNHAAGFEYGNSAKWQGVYGPLALGAMYAFGPQTSQHMMSFHAGYASGNFSVGASYTRDNYVTSFLTTGYNVIGTRIYLIGSSYVWGNWRLMGYYSNAQSLLTSDSNHVVTGALIYQLRPDIYLALGADYANARNIHNVAGTQRQIEAAAYYSLSKRTQIYSAVVAARGNGFVQTSIGIPAGQTAPSTAGGEVGARFGITTRF